MTKFHTPLTLLSLRSRKITHLILKSMTSFEQTFFAPHLTVRDVKIAVDFYIKALNAKVLRSWANPNGTLHVAELEINGAMFHLHEEVQRFGQLSAETLKSTSVVIGLFTPDPDKLMHQAKEAGGVVINEMQDYEYGYRQGTLLDPFSHHWLLQKKI
jgi:PhnB protein